MPKNISTGNEVPKLNAEIEYLRAIAVLLVVSVHIPALLHWGPMVAPFYGADGHYLKLLNYFDGWTGVDLFFCISGFVISKSFIESFDRFKAGGDPWRSMKAFWVRRFFRIAPSAWTWLAVMLTCSIAFNHSGTFFSLSQNLRSAIPILAGVANFASPDGGLIPNGVYWSLALEEQFYFVFPFFLLFVSGKWRWRLLLVLIALQLVVDRSDSNSILWITRTDALMWGVIVYLFSQTSQYKLFAPSFCSNRWAGMALSGLLIWLIGALPTVAHLKTLSLVAIASAILVFMASYNRGYVLPLPKAMRSVLLWIGSRSYGIYLIHIPAFYMTYEMWFRFAANHGRNGLDATFTLRLILTAMALVPLLAELNYRLIERPLRRRGAAIAKRILATGPSPTIERVLHRAA